MSEWSTWMQEFGRRNRKVREMVGLSQEELAQLAGVSQGAISRLENGRGVATPLVVVLKVNVALASELRKLDPALLDDRMRRAIEVQDSLAPPGSARVVDDLPSFKDAMLEELIGLYRQVPERQRPLCVAMVRAMVDALRTGSSSAA